ncbi:extracellular solute-binding protein [Amnibacterium sp. CER49]|uniref:ABC transporter substrate-binding protein n=1 Tax=Amnibacterium sp. CER49 TaxID=3039161 RepID=UPI002449A6F1|nr:extracellular solute-binding protein [Amnibacterium sp. CER49]MDH2444866.1 extracellular solute-binding protein [Amnibacterium sp. CER49]
MSQSTTTRIRRAAAIAAVAAVGVSLAACSGGASGSGSGSGGGSSAKEPQSFTFAFSEANTKDNSLEQVATAFEKLHKGVKITIQKLPAESVGQAIATRVQGGNAPDVFAAESGIGQVNAIQPWAKAGLLLPITDPAVTTALKPAGLSQFQYGGKTYAVSRGSGLNGIIWNADAAKSIGVNLTDSSTFQDVLSGCAAAKAKGKSLFGLAGAVPPNPGILAQIIATSTVYGPDQNWNTERAAGKVKFATTAGWKQALEAIQTMYKQGCFQPGATGAGFDALTNGASSGQFFGFFAPGGAAASVNAASGGHVHLTVLPLPSPSGTTYASVSSDQVVAASAKTKSPKLVQQFLSYIAGPDGQKVVSVGVGYPVGTKDASALPDTYKPVASILTSPNVRSFPSIEWTNGKISNDLGAGVQGILTGQKTVAQVLDQLDTDWG